MRPKQRARVVKAFAHAGIVVQRHGALHGGAWFNLGTTTLRVSRVREPWPPGRFVHCGAYLSGVAAAVTVNGESLVGEGYEGRDWAARLVTDVVAALPATTTTTTARACLHSSAGVYISETVPLALQHGERAVEVHTITVRGTQPYANVTPGYHVTDQGRLLAHTTTGVFVRSAAAHADRTGVVSLDHGARSYRVTLGRLVARAFLPPPADPNAFVGFFDGNRFNCHPTNLHWRGLTLSMARRVAELRAQGLAWPVIKQQLGVERHAGAQALRALTRFGDTGDS